MKFFPETAVIIVRTQRERQTVTNATNKPLTLAEVGEKLGLSDRTVAKLIQKGELVAENYGTGRNRFWRVFPDALDAFRQRRRVPTAMTAGGLRRRKTKETVTQYV